MPESSTEVILDQVQQLSHQLARTDREEHRRLVKLRHANRLTQDDIAYILGCPVKKIRKFERYDSDPRQSLTRRYEVAVTLGRAYLDALAAGEKVTVPSPTPEGS